MSSHKEYITAQGDTFDLLALAAYNDEKKASVIIDANPRYCSTLVFPTGIKLTIPAIDRAAEAKTLPPWRQK